MRLSLIVAMDQRGVIGRGGGLPWKLSADLKRFKALTMGHHIVMGRKTFDSLGRPLPGRVMLVMSRESSVGSRSDLAVVRSMDEALVLAVGDEEVFVIGGAEIFKLRCLEWKGCTSPGWRPKWRGTLRFRKLIGASGGK